MYESSATWSIVAADGTTASFNDGTGLLLEDVTGFDSPNIRQNVQDLPETDGATAGYFFMGSRPVTLRGRMAGYATAAARNQAVVNLQRALRGLRGDVTIKSAPSGLPAMQVSARLDNVRVTGGYVKEFMISLVCPDPLIYSQTLNTQATSGSVASTGAAFPLVFPIVFGGGTGATVTVNATNAGNYDTPPYIRVTGPVSDPQIKNASTQQSIWIDNVLLVSGEYIDIDMAARTAVKSDGANLYSRVRFPASDWWRLAPSTNVIQMFSSTSGSSTLTVQWRDAWV